MKESFEQLESVVNQAFDGDTKEALKDPSVVKSVEAAIACLDNGSAKVCTKSGENWQVNEWLKKAVLLYFQIRKMGPMKAGDLAFYDKIPLKKWSGDEGVRVVPHAVVRYGSFVNTGAVLMPSYVNIGASVGKGTMVDTWATVGSCAQVGDRVHLSGGVGVGGVLEPVQAKPVIIENDCFVGSRCIVVEGVHLEEGVVLAAGLTLTASTQIIDVSGSSEKVLKGRVPKNSVVIPGTRPKEFPAGTYQVGCALIIGQRTESTDRKTSLTQAIRDFDLSL